MSAHTITGRDPRSGRTLLLTVRAGTISCLETCQDQTDLYLSPGFIDLQVNGCSGFDVNIEDLTEETVVGLTAAMIARGVTCFAPTIITAPESAICHAVSVIAEARRTHAEVAACIPFVHIEGPHISALDGYRGAHEAAAVRAPSTEEFDRWQKAGGGIVGMVTLSPHYDGSPAYIAALCERGVHVAIGHTHASPEQIHLAVQAGARLSTHLGNGIAPEIPRHRNPIWPQLAEDRLTATLIADGHHLPQDVLKSIVRAKGVEQCVLVSDSVALAGMPPGVYTTPVGGRVEMRQDGRLCMFGSDLLAGCTASLAECIGNVVRATGISLCEALTMATVNPGRFVGGRGELTAGSRADIVRFRWNDNEILINDVWLAGKQVYSSSSAKAQKSKQR